MQKQCSIMHYHARGILKLIDENNEIISGIGEIGLDTTYTNSDEEFKNPLSMTMHYAVLFLHSTMQIL